MPGSERPLDTNEEIFRVFDAQYAACRTAQALRLTGPVSEAVMREALQRLVQLHPRLGTHIADDGAGVVWRVANETPTLHLLPAERIDAGEQLLAQALRGSATVPGWWVEWAARGDDHLVCLVLHHSLADGVSAARLAADLVDLVNDVIESRPPRPAIPPAAPLDTALPPIGTGNGMAYRIGRLRWRLFGKPAALPAFEAKAGPGERTTRVLFDDVDAVTTTTLRKRANEEGATVGGALTAAVLRAIGTVDDLHGPLDVATQVSLRKRCQPPIPIEAIGCHGARALTQHEPQRPFWRLAKECTTAVHRSVARGESEIPLARTRGKVQYVSEALSRLVDNPDNLGRTCTLAISNVGVMPSSSPGPVRLAGFYPAIANHPAGSLYQLSCGTLDGILQCCWMYVAPLVSDERARTIWQVARDELMRAAT